MPWLNNKIKPNNDTYPFDKINCFEKPVGIALDSFGENYSSYYYMFVKLIQSYNIKGYIIKNNKNFDMNITKKLLEDVFAIKLDNIKTDNCIFSVIKEQIDKNNPVLIPANLIELFYSKYYKESDWPHLFLIKGYDEKHELYNIVDYLHLSSDEGVYKDFVMPFSTMNKLYGKYNSSIAEKAVYYLENTISEYNDNSHLDKFMENFITLYLDLQDEQPYKEVDFINQINNHINKSDDTCDEKRVTEDVKLDFLTTNLMNIIKYKEVFIDEFLNNFSFKEGYNDLKEKLINSKKDLASKWYLIINRILRKVYRRKKIDIDECLLEIIKYEEVTKSIIRECTECYSEQLKFTKKTLSVDINNGNYYYENNTDNIIQLVKDKLLFNFNTNKIYNSWSEDRCPKFVFYNLPKEYSFSVKIFIDEDSTEHSYHAGIFVKTGDNRMFFWGINSGLSLRVDEVGVNTNIFDVDIATLPLILLIRVINKTCYFGFKNIYNNQKKIVGNIYLDNCIINVGVGCKTWGNGTNLSIKFWDWRFDEIK